MKYFVVLAMLALPACSRTQPASVAHDPPAATVSQPKAEADLTTVTLSPDAIKRLGIETAVAQIQDAAGMRTVGGDVVVPEGRRVQVTAPVAGTLVSAVARAGTTVADGAALFRIAPINPAERDQSAEARRAVEAAQADEQVTRQRVQRLEQLLKDGATSMRAVEEARAQLGVASAGLNAARERLKTIGQTTVGPQGDVMIRAPFAGTILAVSAAEGQTVAASAPLAEVAQVSTLWVKVPLYAGDVNDIDTTRSASVTTLGSSQSPRTAVRVTAPPSANPSSASVDLFYEITGAGTALRPGERVTVQLPLKTTERGLAVSDRAILYDIHGGTWVYEDRGAGTYARRRIEIARHSGSLAIVARGIEPGIRVVTAGAAELFGTEFGAGH